MDYIFYLGLALLILGALAIFGFKILPIKKNWNWLFVIVGVLIVTGLGMSLWTGITSLAIAPTGTNTAPNTASYTYSVLATKGNANFLLDENAKVITIPETYNATAVSVNYIPSANFTVGITDGYADMRGVPVQCSTPSFYQQNTSVSDSTQYIIVQKDTSGLADIRISDASASNTAYQRRSRTFLLGGQATDGQSVTVGITATADATAVGKLNQYNSQDITCNIAGQTWVLRVQKTTITV